MFKRVLFIAVMILTISNTECSIVELDKVIAAKKSSRQIPLPDSVYSILPEGVRDCETVTDTNQHFELATISLKYIYRTIEQLILKEKFAPQEAWCIKENDRIILRLERMDGTPYLSFEAARIFQELFHNPIFTLPQLKHITLNCMLLYFRTFMEVCYLNYGLENLEDFACQKQKETLLDPFKKEMRRKKASGEKVESIESANINRLMIQYQHEFCTNIENLFTLLFGTYSKKYMYLHQDTQFFRPEITFNGTPYQATNEIAKSYLILNYELSHFSSVIELDLVNLNAPLRDPEYRERFKKESLIGSIIFKETDKRKALLKNLEKKLADQPNATDVLRYAYILTTAATEQITSDQEKLKAELSECKLREQLLLSKLASHELLTAETNGSKKKKKGQPVQPEESTGPLKKQINKLTNEIAQKNKETAKLLKTIETLETGLTKTNERNKSLENNQREFMSLYNSMLDRFTGMEKIHKELRESHDELTKQIQEIPERSQALQCALDIAGESDLEALVTQHLQLKADIELLNERNTTLKSANLLLGTAYRKFQQENQVLASNVERLSKNIIEQGAELTDALDKNIALTDENENLKRDLLTIEAGKKFGINIPKDSVQLFADNVQLDEENKKIKELNYTLQTQVKGLEEMLQQLSHRTYQAECHIEYMHKTNLLLQESLKKAQDRLSKEKNKNTNYE